MKTQVLRLFLGITMLFPVVTSYSQQSISYEYDHAGNRITRKVITLNTRSSALPQTEEEPLIEKLNSQEIKIYPNPTRGNLRIEINNSEDNKSKMKVLLYSSDGKLVESKESFTKVIQLDLSAMPSAIYILRLEYQGNNFEYKIIKQ